MFSASSSVKKGKTSAFINDSIDYISVSDKIFRQMLFRALNAIETFSCLINEDEQIKFSRHYTSLIDRLCYLQLTKINTV
jgi:hypothetical protein